MSPEVRDGWRRFVIGALVCWAAAVIAFGSLRAVYGERSVYVQVRWAAQVDDRQRESLE